MSYRLESRLKRLETQEQQQHGMPKLYVLRDDELLPEDASDNCLIVRVPDKLSEEQWTKQAQLAQQFTPEEQQERLQRRWDAHRADPPLSPTRRT